MPSTLLQYASLNVFNENAENAGAAIGRTGKTGLGGMPKRPLQDISNNTQHSSSAIAGKKQVRSIAAHAFRADVSTRFQIRVQLPV
jgi:hypothetical protein